LVEKRPGEKLAASLRGLTGGEWMLSLGPPLCSSRGGIGQGPEGGCCARGRRYRCRRCLLKGCERWFRPFRPQARYCSAACQEAARRWRRWCAGQRYRDSEQGRQRRQEQSRRYRARVQQRQRAEAAQLTSPASTAACEGQRPVPPPENSGGVPCHRPGCYTLFPLTPRSPEQRFCSCSCHKALRRVRQREARLRARRRRRRHRRAPSHRGPPATRN
jgi:hypothetical protein